MEISDIVTRCGDTREILKRFRGKDCRGVIYIYCIDIIELFCLFQVYT